jgi:phosphoglycerate dehydrogenase-like enzyme
MMPDSDNDRIQVVVAADISDELIETLREISPRLAVQRHFPDVPEQVWETAEVLYTIRHFPKPEQVPLLRWIQLHYAGMEGVLDRPIVQAEDVEITSASGIHATHMAEFCLGMMLAMVYKLPTMLKFQANAEWSKDRFSIFSPSSLRGQTLGIAGYGSIGRELARQADALGMGVLATKRDVMNPADEEGYTEEGTGDPEGVIPERLYPGEALTSMASDSDFLVITLPLTEATRHSVNEAVFEAMKPGAVLINVARGAVVDEAALISALAAEKIAGAVLDVFEEEPLPPSSPLWNLDNVIISPHVSGNSSDYHIKAAQLFVENLQRYLENRPLLNRLDRDREY